MILPSSDFLETQDICIGVYQFLQNVLLAVVPRQCRGRRMREPLWTDVSVAQNVVAYDDQPFSVVIGMRGDEGFPGPFG
jgi:hypothetical protein